jgi:uncharacterized membrane protein
VAAVPLYYAARRVTASGVCALALALADTLSAPLHSALDYDFHPEVMGFFFIFLALYFLISARPIATMLALLPLLALKEDMALVLLAFALLLALRGHRRAGAVLAAVSVAYIVAVVLIAMPLIRGGSGDLSTRYAYLFDGSSVWTLAPDAAWRAASQLANALPAVARVESSLGFAALLSPAGVAAAAPTLLLATLSDHPQQSALELQYAVPSLALSWVAAVLALAWVAARGEGGAASPRWRRAATFVLAALVLASAAFTFARSSPYSPTAGRYAPPAAHRQAVRDALALVPPAAPVSAQGTLLPHLSHREQAYEFPEVHGASYIVVDAALPVTAQARAAGYDAAVAALPGGHYEQIFARDGVRVFRLLP